MNKIKKEEKKWWDLTAIKQANKNNQHKKVTNSKIMFNHKARSTENSLKYAMTDIGNKNAIFFRIQQRA